MKLSEDDIQDLKQSLEQEINRNVAYDKDPNTCWGMYYFGFDYEAEPITLYFKTTNEASDFSKRVDPSLRSLGWFPVDNKEVDLEQAVSDTQTYLAKLYKELERE